MTVRAMLAVVTNGYARVGAVVVVADGASIALTVEGAVVAVTSTAATIAVAAGAAAATVGAIATVTLEAGPLAGVF